MIGEPGIWLFDQYNTYSHVITKFHCSYVIFQFIGVRCFCHKSIGTLLYTNVSRILRISPFLRNLSTCSLKNPFIPHDSWACGLSAPITRCIHQSRDKPVRKHPSPLYCTTVLHPRSNLTQRILARENRWSLTTVIRMVRR